MKKDIIIIGDGEFADIAYEYFTSDSDFNVVAFAVEKAFYTKKLLHDKPVIYFEELIDKYPPKLYEVFVAITSTNLNRVRKRLYLSVKEMNYSCVSYISSNAFVWNNVQIGDNVLIFENNVIQPNVIIGNNCVLWSGNHVGHRTQIKDHIFISSHCVISGYCVVEDNCFLGVNSTFADNVTIKTNCVIGAGAIILKSTSENCIYPGAGAIPARVDSLRFYKIKE